MKYLAYTKASRPTGRALAQLLGFQNFGIRQARHPLNVLVRWGSRKEMPRASRVLNTALAIKMASDKVLAIEAMSRDGIPTVPCFTTWPEALAAASDGIILGRTRSGMQGAGIVVYDPSEVHDGKYARGPIRPHEWYTIYHEPTREVRLHVVGGEVVRIQGKYLDFPELAGENPFVRNYKTGYRYRTPRRNLHSRRREIAIEAVRALGLDFGAVDMLLFGGEADPMVLEINTAPACSPLTAESYAEAIERMLP